MEHPIEVLIYLFGYLPGADRAIAGQTCKQWYEAATDRHFLNKKYVLFYRTLFDDSGSEILAIFENSPTLYTNYVFKEVEISTRIHSFWEKIGQNITHLTLDSCDVCEKVFLNILNQCPNLVSLRVESCRELFMSGRLMEGASEEFRSESLMSLKSLSLAGNRYLSDALFNRFVAAAPLLEEINISNCSVSFHSGLYKKFYPFGRSANGAMTPSESVLTFHFILEFIVSRAKHLKKLSFSNTLIDGSALKLLSEVKELSIVSLEVHACDQLTNAGILSLACHQKNLRELDIGLCSRVTDQSLVHICNNLVNLEYLNIQRCRAVTDLGITELNKLTKLISLNISQCELISSDGIQKGLCQRVNLILKELIINSLNLDQQIIVVLSEKLPNLRKLDISFCFNAITDTSIQAIFKNQIWLQSLKMSYCDKVSDAGLTGMGKCTQETESDDERPIMNPYDEQRTVHRIYLGSRAEEEIVRDAQRKRHVQLMCENIGPNDADSYSGYSLARLKGLRELDVSGCNRITDVSLIYAFNFKELVSLDLSRCQQITHLGMACLVRNCPSIERLNLVDCFNLKDQGIEKITKGLLRLKDLHLRGCNQLTDKSLELIRSHCKHLKILDVQGCRNMSPELACSLGYLPTLHTVLMSKPGPYISEGVKNRTPAPPPLPIFSFRRIFS